MSKTKNITLEALGERTRLAVFDILTDGTKQRRKSQWGGGGGVAIRYTPTDIKAAFTASRKANRTPVLGVVLADLQAVVIDIDPIQQNGDGEPDPARARSDGARAREATVAALGEPLATRRSRKPGGWHLWYCAQSLPDGERPAKAEVELSIDGTPAECLSGEHLCFMHRQNTGEPDLVQFEAALGLATRDGLEGGWLDGAALADFLIRHAKPKEPRGEYTEGNRNNALNRDSYIAGRNGDTQARDAAKAKALAAGTPPSEAAEVNGRAYADGEADAAAKPAFTRDLAGFLGACAVLRVEVRYNIRAHAVELRREGARWEALNDRASADLQEEIAARCRFARSGNPLLFGDSTFRRALLAAVSSREADPFAEWLDGLPAWDGTARLDGLLPNLGFDLGEADPGLYRWAGRFLCLGAVWRTYRPGTKLDEMPVLIGPQGCGKSTALRLLLPDEHPEWFTDGLHLAAFPRERAEAIQGRVIVEAGEMAGAGRAELESLKSFISRQDDGNVRFAYRRDTETTLRRCIFAGTANGNPLPNDTQNRRFVALPVRGGDPARARVYLAKHRAQLWAEAKHLYGEGVEAWLPDSLAKPQAVVNENYRLTDAVLEDRLEAWLAGDGGTFTKPPNAKGFTTAEAAEAVGEHKRSRAVSAALSRLTGQPHPVLSRARGRPMRLWTAGETGGGGA